MNDKEENLQIYNKCAAGFAAKFNNIGPRTKDVEKGFSFIKKDNPRVVELGCANGRDAKEILKHTNDYLGIDYSEELIKIARKEVPSGKFEVADFSRYDFPKDVDIVFSFASLLHSDKEEFRIILDKIHKALVDGGIFYIALKFDEYQRKEKTDEFGKRVYYFYTLEDIRKLIGNNYDVLGEEQANRRGQEWINVILQKV